MKLIQKVAVVLAAVLLLTRLAYAQGGGKSFGLSPSGDSHPVTIEAGVIEQSGNKVRALGDVLVLSGDRKITAQEASYDWSTGVAHLRKAVLTTCTAANPDYRFVAEELTMSPPDRIHARRIAFFLGKTRVISMARLRMRVTMRGDAADLFPRPSYDKEGGLAISQKFLLIDTNRALATTVVRLSAKEGPDLDFESAIGLDGVLTPRMDQPLSFPAMRTIGLAVPTSPGKDEARSCTQLDGPTRLRGFARFSSRVRSYNAGVPNLRVYRQPELGLDYIGRPVNIGGQCPDSKLSMNPEISASWGRLREAGGDWHNRTSYGAVVPLNVTSLSKNIVLQPVFQMNQSVYDSGSTYTWYAGSVGVSHIRENGTLQALRYIKRSHTGSTPLQFDRMHVLDELQAAVQFQRKRHLLAFVVGYDLDAGEIYDWSVLFGHRTDCLAVMVDWSNLQRTLAFKIQITAM